MTAPNTPALWTWVTRDGMQTRLLRCPVCGVWGEIDDDQFDGVVSIEHSIGPDDSHPDALHGESGCTFHEKIDLRQHGEFVKPEHYHQLMQWPARGSTEGPQPGQDATNE